MSALDILSFDSGAKRLNDWFQEVQFHSIDARFCFRSSIFSFSFIFRTCKNQHKRAKSVHASIK